MTDVTDFHALITADHPQATAIRAAAEAALQGHIDRELIPGASYAVLQGREVIAANGLGHAEVESATALRPDHLFRAMSNTKLVTSIAVLQLWEEGRIDLDEPVGRHIPQLAAPRVLVPGATSLDDTEPAASPITVRQLLTHTAGLSYGLLDPGTLLFKAYNERQMISTRRPLQDMVDALAELPLAFHPGTEFEYSVATDVLGHLLEVLTGQRLGEVFRQRIFAPLGMADTAFSVPEADAHRLVAYYGGADRNDPRVPGLKRLHAVPYPGAYLSEPARHSGGGGLVTSLPDMVALLRALVPDEAGGAATVLKPATLALMMDNHLAPGQFIRFATLGRIPNRGYGLGGCVTLQPTSLDPAGSTGEFQWGGMAGTHWWISPRTGLAAVLMAQRHMGFWNPYAFDFKRAVYSAAGH